jgi:hypothetical protein
MKKSNQMSQFTSVIVAVAVISTFTLLNSSVQATVTELVSAPPTLYYNGGYSADTVGGIAFQVNPGPTVGVESLGRYYFPGNESDGVRTLSLLELTNVAAGFGTSTGTVLATTSLTPSASGLSPDGFNYAPLTQPVILQAGHTYMVLSDQPGSSTHYTYGSADSSFTYLTSPFTYVVSGWGGASAGWNVQNTTGVGVTTYSYSFGGSGNLGPVSLQYELPEPSTLALLGVGGLLMCQRMRGSKRKAILR